MSTLAKPIFIISKTEILLKIWIMYIKIYELESPDDKLLPKDHPQAEPSLATDWKTLALSFSFKDSKPLFQ